MKNLGLSVWLVAMAIACGSGCASIVDGHPDKPVAVYSVPSGAKLTVFDRKGRLVCTATTPATINLRRAHGFCYPEEYHMVFEYPGFYPSETIVTSKIDRWYLGNLCFGWVIGLGAVDPATGAMWTLPPEINRNLTSSGSALTHEELEVAERAANPNDQWREAGVIQHPWPEP